MNLTMEDVLGVKHLSAHNISWPGNKKFSGVSTDSRTVAKGNLFVALRGDNHDGNTFVSRAFRRGASAAIVDSPGGRMQAGTKPVIVVRDGVTAFGALASAYRRKFSIPVVAVAGSNGKTTAREMIAAVLAKKFRVLRTRGNLNNHIGVPMTLFGIRKGHEMAVIEIGTNHFGEVKRLAQLSLPTHGIVTNIGREHLRYFRDLNGVAKAEGELYDHMKETGGMVFVNADDSRLLRRGKRLPKKVTYGFCAAARTVRGKNLHVAENGCAEFTVTSATKRAFRIKMSVPGTQNASNGLAAAAVGLEFGVRPEAVRAALAGFRSVGKRMEIVRAGGVTILNDTYNANPDSVESALETLSRISARGKRIVVLADMLELGRNAGREHERVGRTMSKFGFTEIFTFGPMAKRYCAGAQRGRHFPDKGELARELKKMARPGDVVLVKGSRGMKMEDVVEALREHLRRAA